MALGKRWFGRGGPPAVDLPELQQRLGGMVSSWAGRLPDPELTRARLADGLRDAGLRPATSDEFDALAAGLDDEAWRRLMVLSCVLDQAEVRTALAELARVRPATELLAVGFVGVARGTALVTLDLLAREPLRVEEIARHLLAGLGLAVRGETARASQARLERLDYGRLMAEAERARAAAAARMAQLHKLQDEQEQRRPGRGKW